ncbi:hypothetical protein FACS1894166_07900 [Bacilli bacterium]|nr:hypothetical protein FACS1894166_07900 [Bacilli bacterium]
MTTVHTAQNAFSLVTADGTFASVSGTIKSVSKDYEQNSPLMPVITRNDHNTLTFAVNPTFCVISTAFNEAAPENSLLKDIVTQILDGVDTVCEANTPDNKPVSPHPVRLVEDEAGSGTPVPYEIVEQVLTKGRSRDVIQDALYQNISQIEDKYKHVDNAIENFVSNSPLFRCIKIKSTKSANFFAEKFGKHGTTVLHRADDKKGEYRPDEFLYTPDELKNKENYNIIMKCDTDNIDVTSAPMYPLYYLKKLSDAANKVKLTMKPRKAMDINTFREDYLIQLKDLFDMLINGSEVEEGKIVNFAAFEKNPAEPSQKQYGSFNKTNRPGNPYTPFYTRFSNDSNLSSWDTDNNYKSEYSQEYERHKVNQSFEEPNDSEEENLGVSSDEYSQTTDETDNEE